MFTGDIDHPVTIDSYTRVQPQAPSRGEGWAWQADPMHNVEPHGPVDVDAAALAIADAIAHGGGDTIVMAKVRRVLAAMAARATVPADCFAI